MADTEVVETNIFDVVEVHENVTVEILRNSVTGEISIGWWPGTYADRPGSGGPKQ